MTEPAILRLLADFFQHTSEGSVHYADLAHNHTGIKVPDVVVSGLSNVTHHALHHGSRIAGVAGDLARHISNATSKHLANLTERVGNIEVDDLVDGAANVGGHLANAGASALHHGSRAVDQAVSAERKPRRLESPTSSRASLSKSSLEEELECNPDIDGIIATCEDLPLGSPGRPRCTWRGTTSRSRVSSPCGS
ncbi:unnamed protein product [Prorocentrum cordatum]|uniref:Uncharacterized protein n=1 Tax=Prorocentrum cordatum TaxID=2364126 RepID=A0ABN9QV48_9DINO|nr:unnamed protein product [Polarella glacialis]